MELFIHGVYIIGGLLVYGAACFVAGHLRGQKVADDLAAVKASAIAAEKKLAGEIVDGIHKVAGKL